MTPKHAEKQKRIDAWLQEKVFNRECPFCQAKKWKVEEQAALAGLASNGPEFSRAYVPVIPVCCEECGLVLPISMKAMGIVPPY